MRAPSPAAPTSSGSTWSESRIHPYQWRFLDTWSLLADLLARMERVRFFPDVANLPLRGPAMIAKQAASFDALSNGRFELGLGAGAFWDAIAAMGGPRRSGREALEALEDAIAIVRASWSGERTISVEGEHYSVRGLHPGPAPAHAIEIWLDVGKPRSLRSRDGSPTAGCPPSSGRRPSASRTCGAGSTDAAAAAGRDPAAIRRVYTSAAGSATRRAASC